MTTQRADERTQAQEERRTFAEHRKSPTETQAKKGPQTLKTRSTRGKGAAKGDGAETRL